MSPRGILKSIKIGLFAIVIGTPLFYLKWAVFPYTIPKTAFFQIVVEIIFFLWVALAIGDKRYRPRMTPLLWAIAAYLGVLTVTAFTGVDIARSFFSAEQRAFGIVTWYHLAALALVASAVYRDIPWKKLWYASFGTSVFAVGLAALQLAVKNLLLVETITGRPGGTFGNPTFLAGYLLFNFFFAGYYLLSRPSRGESIFLWGIIIVNAVGVFLTQTRGDILGLFAGIFILIILFVIRPPQTGAEVGAGAGAGWLSRRSLYAVLLGILVVAGGTVWFTRNNAVWTHVPGLDRLKNLTLQGADSDIVPRELAFAAAWKGFLARPVVGWGYENFNVVFSQYYNPKVLEYGYSESDFDKPHDVPLEELDAGGVPLLLAYLATLVAFLWQTRKTKDAALLQIMTALTAAYFVRSLVIFDTLGPAMMLYLMFGFVNGKSSAQEFSGAAKTPEKVPEKAKEKQDKREKPISGGVVALMMVPAAVLIYAFNITGVYAASEQYYGYITLGANAAAGIADFHAAIGSWNPYQWDFARDYANTIAQAYFYNNQAVAPGEILFAINQMKGVEAAHPNDAYNHYLLADIYNLTYNIDPKNYLAAAETEEQAALVLSPDRQEIYFYESKTKSLEGDNVGAEAVAKTALDLDPNVADAHFYYGMLAFANGQSDIGYGEVETAIAMGRQWHDFYEPSVAADYFADAGHIPQAIELYKAALVLQPGDLETEIKLGAAYYLNNQSDLARPLFLDAASRFDFTTSPQFAQYEPILQALGIPLHPAASH